MAKFIEVKYGKSVRLINVDSIALVKPGTDVCTIIKLKTPLSAKGDQTFLCDDDYEKFIARLKDLSEIQRV